MANTQLCDATHVLTYIAIKKNTQLTSGQIAESLQTAPSLVRRIMSRLAKAGLVHTVQGSAKPSLTKPANQITLLDVYLAINDHPQLLKIDQHTSKTCPVGSQIPAVVHHYYDEIQSAAQAKMSLITLQDIIADLQYRQRTFSVGTK